MAQTIPNWFHKNKVLLAGLAAAIALALQQFVGVAVTDYWVVGFAVFTAATAFIVRNARGQWITIGTLIGTAGAAIYKAHENGGHVDVFQLILLAVLSALGAAAPAAKSLEYEHSAPILEAKAEAKAMVEAKKEEDNKPDSKPPTIKYT